MPTVWTRAFIILDAIFGSSAQPAWLTLLRDRARPGVVLGPCSAEGAASNYQEAQQDQASAAIPVGGKVAGLVKSW
jgi:hypothetical protein